MVAALYFDGRRAMRHEVALVIAGGRVEVTGDEVRRQEALGDVAISDRIGSTPRVLRFSDGAHCEVGDVEALTSLLQANGITESRVSRWEENRRVVALAVGGLLLTAAVVYFAVLPVVAATVVRTLPESTVAVISRGALDNLDRRIMQPSRLPRDRQAELTAAFQRLTLPAGERPQLQLLFRSSRFLGPNAFALPSGTIILTDDLVRIARDDREILGVLAHEIGHVAGSHGLRQMAQGSMMAVLLGWYLGDVSILATIMPAAILQAKYSRDFERDADDYAATTLAANGIALSHLAAILERFEALQKKLGATAATFGYLSSHPATAERLARLRRE